MKKGERRRKAILQAKELGMIRPGSGIFVTHFKYVRDHVVDGAVRVAPDVLN